MLGWRWLGALCLAGMLSGATGCKNKNERWEGAQEAAEQRAEEKAKGDAPKAVEGGKLNAFFPADGVDGLKRTFEQEKDGFVQAKYAKDGAEATLSISDLVQNEDARKKFADATEKLGSDPLTTVGKNQTTALVADRWQIKVSSQAMDHAARKALLEKFDLGGLRSFNPPTK
ncbi:hypothetical protein [Sorangium sp. So ce1099]|uniref:hypothetical protein n=1 Tax=Sorangium sp. So ce1099 TaxID=3133331 RepID=UPI003F6024B4